MFDRNQKNFHPAKIFAMIGIVLLFVSILASIVMYLWNAILVEVLSVNPLTFIQALGLLVLSRILFGRLPFGKSPMKNKRRHMHWKDKWKNMSDEERRAYKEKWKKRHEWKKRMTEQGGEEQEIKVD